MRSAKTRFAEECDEEKKPEERRSSLRGNDRRLSRSFTTPVAVHLDDEEYQHGKKALPAKKLAGNAQPIPTGEKNGAERKLVRMRTMPSTAFRTGRADIPLSTDATHVLDEIQDEFNHKVDKGLVKLSCITEDQFKGCWRENAKCHLHGIDVDCQRSGDEKRIDSFGVNPNQYLEQMKFVFSSLKGTKGSGDTSPNQDNFSVTHLNSGWTIFCVFDGHGPYGHLVSTRISQSVPYFLIKSKLFPRQLDSAMGDAFEKADKDLLGYAVKTRFDVQGSGSSGVMCVRNPSSTQLWVAWIGDARAVVGSETDNIVKYETTDHRPDNQDEEKRIIKAGGDVRQHKSAQDGIMRVYAPNVDYPGLCMSRCFGDACVKEYGVICKPTVEGPVAFDKMGKTPYMLVASDGLFEFFDAEWIVKAINRKLPTDGFAKVLHKLVKEARRKWKEEEEDEYCDDITAMLVLLR